jgi:hypothetical protein
MIHHYSSGDGVISNDHSTGFCMVTLLDKLCLGLIIHDILQELASEAYMDSSSAIIASPAAYICISRWAYKFVSSR